jgi:predicted Zn-ribbon and HTH transcriptional regulator
MSRIDDLRKRFEGQQLRWVKWGYKRENHEVRDALGRASSVTYSVSEEDMKLILAGYACYQCGLIFMLGGLPIALPECPFCLADQTQRDAVVAPDGWNGA